MPHKVYTPEEILQLKKANMTASSNAAPAPIVLGAGGKALPAPYKSTGNEALDTLAFLHLLEQLKVQKRSGWIREGASLDPYPAIAHADFQVTQPESISDHMCRMALMAMMLPTDPQRPLNIARCVMMALVHDLAEAHVGDITPVEGVTPEVKHQLEEDAMNSFLNEMLGGEGNTEARERFRSLFEEYEARETPEAKLVKDLDRLELALQAVEYERSQDIRTLHPFFTGSIPNLEHPVVRQWADSLMVERKQLWASRGRATEEQAGLEGCGGIAYKEPSTGSQNGQ